MKAEIQKDGFIRIIAENYTEAYALQAITPRMDGESCGHCGRQDIPVIFDGSVLNHEIPGSFRKSI